MVFSLHKDKVLKDMDEEEEMRTLSSSEEESDETDEDVENERRLQRALLEKDKVWFVFSSARTSLGSKQSYIFVFVCLVSPLVLNACDLFALVGC